ncbi:MULTISPECIES: RNA polymerase subunit sigma-70 [unclassified Bacillus (in: firmicutes)]|uniref:RNA polymerase subunit sigma-70 n=1 Tax=unclassified Bacillus (in: firmicutes) TaxID=185979 RepID=UPI0008E170BB|nr:MULTISPECIES: RNA polymerase subunit sigma-70 [unclassified Bacillus (in: firmicutes)]SFI77280.1 RNA polymerase sigma-70 factor, ECF subfamily [Bacillus sp. 71mf]SFS86836.1 RNA polymerase sigma-70 factor, ECF subfamily [Bacillus sp. 103mf]
MNTKRTMILQPNSEIQQSNRSIIIKHYAELKRYCTFLTKNIWDGEDLAQETICKVLKKYTDTEWKQSICLTLLYKVARNQWLDQMRTKAYEKESNKEASYEPHENVAELYALIETMLSCLNEMQTVIFLLKDVFEYSLADIAAITSMSEGAVKASLFRTRNKLKTIKEEERLVSSKDMEEETEILVKAIRQQRPELLVKLIPTLQFSKISLQQPLLLLHKRSSYNCFSCAA